MEQKTPQIGDKVTVRDFKSQGESVGDVEMVVVDHSIGTYEGSAKRVRLRSDEHQFTGWMPVDRLRTTTEDIE